MSPKTSYFHADGSELQNKLGDNFVLNPYRVELFSDMKREILDYLGKKLCGEGKEKGHIKGQLTANFTCQCFVCGKTGFESLNVGGMKRYLRNLRFQASVAKASLARKAKGKTPTTGVLEASCVSEPNDIQTWWTIRETENGTTYRSTQATIEILEYRVGVQP